MEGNLEVYEKEGYVWVSINPRIYTMDIIYSAAYSFVDRCYVLIDGDVHEEIIVELRPKESTDLKTLGREFNNELVIYAAYASNCARNARLREAILKRVLLTNDTEMRSSVKNVSTEAKAEKQA